MRKNFLLIVSLVLFTGCVEKSNDTQAGKSSEDTVQVIGESARTAKLQPLSYEQRQGKNLFTKYCFVCHGTEGKGDGFNSFNLNPKPRDLSNTRYMNALTDDRIAETVREGGRGVNRSSLMPSWGGRLSKDEITYVVAYVRTLAAGKKAHD